MKVVCPHCSAIVPASDLNMFQMAAKCTPCNSIFDFSSQIESENIRPVRKPKLSPEVMRPPEVVLSEEGDTATIVWRPAYRLTLMRGVLIAMVALLFVPSFVRSILVGLWRLDTLFLGFMMLWFTYQILTTVVNRTTIEFSDSKLLVDKGPLPPKLQKEFAVDNLAHLYVREVFSERFFRKFSYQILGIDPVEDTHRVIVSGFDSHDAAQFVRQEIERKIGLRDNLERSLT